MDINWFPGHMARTLRKMIDHLRQVDLVIETCDARIPESSRNPELSKLIGSKPRILVLNKADLADPAATQAWTTYFSRQGMLVLATDSTKRVGPEKIREAALLLMTTKIEKAKSRGRLFQPVRAMVAGIPNTGKSTLINTLAKKKVAAAQDRPGVTRSASWIRTGQLELLDTPGVLWPKLGSRESQIALAATGAIRDVILDLEEVTISALILLYERYPLLLAERYGVGAADLVIENAAAASEDALAVLPADESEESAEKSAIEMRLNSGALFLTAAARKRGCILSGGRVDTARFAVLFLDELRGGKIGRISLEWPPESAASESMEVKEPDNVSETQNQ